MQERKKVYHYCSSVHHRINCTKMAVVTDQPPAQLDDRELLWELEVLADHLEYLGEGEYQVRWASATSFRHRVARVTFWHACDPLLHVDCPISSGCPLQTTPERLADQVLFRIHPPRKTMDGEGELLVWVVESIMLGSGHYELPGAILELLAVPAEGKIIVPVLEPV